MRGPGSFFGGAALALVLAMATRPLMESAVQDLERFVAVASSASTESR